MKIIFRKKAFFSKVQKIKRKNYGKYTKKTMVF